MRDSLISMQSRVIGALMLRDIKTRFGGNPANYVIAIGWPIGHIVLLLVVYSAAGRAAPYGSSATQFFATGVMPFITFNYCARFSMFALLLNSPLMGFPIVKMLDIVLARIFLEIISSLSVVLIVTLGLLAIGVDAIPQDPATAIQRPGGDLALCGWNGPGKCAYR